MADHIASRSLPFAGETQADYRRRVELLQAEALELREQEISAQCSPLNTAADRIRIWERRHQLSLPRNPDHPLISVIAIGTGLSREEVQAEQRLRVSTQPATREE